MQNALRLPPRHELIFMGIALVANVLLDVALLAGRAAIEEWRPQVCPDYVRYGAEGFLLGCFFAQIAVLAIGTALLSGSDLLRLNVAALYLLCAVYGLSALVKSLALHGYYVKAGPTADVRAMAAHWLFAVVVFYVIQIPLWILRTKCQLRITDDASTNIAPQDASASFNRLVGLAAFVVVPTVLSMAIIRNDGLRSFGMLVLSLSLVSAAFELPILWAVLGIRRVVPGLVALALLSEILVWIGSAAYASIHPAPWMDIVAAFRGVQLAVVVVAIGNALLMRLGGYRLTARVPSNHAAVGVA